MEADSSPLGRNVLERNALLVGILVVATAIAYWPDTVALWRYWMARDLNAQDGLLVACLSAALLYRSHRAFEAVPVEPVPWACLPLVACGTASLIAWRAGILTLQLSFLPLILEATVLCALGVRAARVAAFPVGFLYFGLPGWGLLGPTLQRLTIVAVGVFGPLVGLPLVMTGTTVSLPRGITFEIGRPCSGVDFFTVGLAVAALIGELERASLRRRVALLGAMAIVAIVSNWVRVLLIVGIGYATNLQNPLATSDHLALGWVVFAAALLLFVWLAGRGRRAGNVPAERSDASPANRSDASLAGRSEAALVGSSEASPAGSTGARVRLAWGLASAIGALLACPALVYATSLTAARAAPLGLHLPDGRTPWRISTRAPDGLWNPVFVGKPLERRAVYEDDAGHAVEVVAIGYPAQAQGRQILSEDNSLLGDSGLSIEAQTVATGPAIPHGEVVVADEHGRRSLIWSFIDIGGHLFAQPVYSQLWYGLRSLVDVPYSALFAMRTLCEPSCGDAHAILASFLHANGRDLLDAIASSPASKTQQHAT